MHGLDLYYGTQNPDKERQIARYFVDHTPAINLFTLLNIPFPIIEIEETGATFQANAHLKLDSFCRSIKGGLEEGGVKSDGSNIIAATEDAGMMVDHLNILPASAFPPCVDFARLPHWDVEGRLGIYTKRFAGPNTSEEERNQIILDLLAGLPHEHRTAQFVCHLEARTLGGHRFAYRGVWQGHIATEQRGDDGSGIDLIFIPRGYDKTVAELPLSLRNGQSHRGQAIRALIDWIDNLPLVRAR